MANTAANPSAVHSPAGAYSHSMAVPGGSQVIFLAGQIGLNPDGNAAVGFLEQAHRAYSNVAAILAHHGLGMDDVVKMTAYLTDPADLPTYSEVRAEWLGDARPASTLLIVAGLALPELKVEIDVVAATTR